MKIIQLTKGMETRVDDADFEWLSKWKWKAHKVRHGFYAVRNLTRGSQYMHRAILGLKPGTQGDHRDGDKLNNQRYNLRKATNAQNNHGFKTPQRDKTAPFRGVSFEAWTGRYKAQLGHAGRTLNLGRFDTAEEAARVRDAVAKKLYKEFAQLNFPV